MKIVFVSIALLQVLSLTGQFVLMSYNIRYDNSYDTLNSWEKRKTAVVRLMDFYDADIIGTQEGLSNQVKYMDSCLTDYACTGVGREDGVQKGEYCAIFYDTSRVSLLSGSTFWLSESPENVSVGWDAALERICTWGLFENLETSDRLLVFNAHLDHQGALAREKSAELLIAKIGEINTGNYPVVLMGDFNATPESKPVSIIKKQMSDGFAISDEYLNGPLGTFNGFNTDAPVIERIDYIFTSGLDVSIYSHIDDRMDNRRFISDHFPVLAVVYVK